MTKEQIALELVKLIIKPDDISYAVENASKIAQTYNIILKSLNHSLEQSNED